MRRLAVNVVVRDPQTLGPVVFAAGDEVPAWAENLITNPDVWAAPHSGPDVGPDDEPPRAGRGSGRDAWETYADSRGIEVTDDMGRDDIITALEGHGVIERQE